MSQAKVDRYKEEKRNRAKNMAREKRNNMLAKLGSSVIAAALVVWVGYSVYTTVVTKPQEDKPVTVTSYTIDTAALDDYMSTLPEA